MNKKCSKCGEILDFSQFHKSKGEKYGLAPRCKICRKKTRRECYLKYRDNELAKAKIWRENFRKWWTEIKSNFSCSVCGENHPGCVQFHHHENNKIAEVSALAWGGKNKQAVMDEIAKCIPLCANCHAKLHWEERNGKYCGRNVDSCD